MVIRSATILSISFLEHLHWDIRALAITLSRLSLAALAAAAAQATAAAASSDDAAESHESLCSAITRNTYTSKEATVLRLARQ